MIEHTGRDACVRAGSTLSAAIAVGVAACLVFAAPARASIINFSATLDQAQETPPTGSGGTGTGTFVMDTDANTLSISITYSGLTSPTIAGHIHGFAPMGTPAGILFPFANPNSPVSDTWPFSESDQPQIIAGLTYANIHTTMFVGGEIRGQILRVPSCGDGILDGGEDCDDGNNTNGDCCSATCTFEAAGSDCTGNSLCSVSGQCDGAGSCVAAPRMGCRGALKSILLLKNDTDDSKDKLIWKWIKGDMTVQADFGVPTGTTNYALCIYAGTANALLDDPQIPASATLWSPISTKGYKYKDPAGSEDGIQKVILKGGDQGKAKALVKGKGSGLPQPTLSPSVPLPVTAQLVNSANNNCFEGVYDSGAVIKNDGVQFKAKAQ